MDNHDYVEIALRVPKDTPLEAVHPLLDAVRALGIEVRSTTRGHLLRGPLEVAPVRLLHPTVARIRAARVALREGGQ